MNDRLAAEVELLWDDFHRTVNMTSEELRTWLLTEASGETAMPADPGMDLPELGRHVVRILGKRKVDLTSDDVTTMRQVVEYVQERLEKQPEEGASNDGWRRDLMTVGHDPLRPETTSML
ncbi:DUF3140 domain-containing protein [Actinomadura kijaniata]|uniref:DUF3140 domain-containing protein n=1 Tax=Actinomadura kijaniata TaxID=46161 RepID=UPI003F19CCBE